MYCIHSNLATNVFSIVGLCIENVPTRRGLDLYSLSCLQAPVGESQPSTDVDLFVSTEKVMVLNTDLQVKLPLSSFHCITLQVRMNLLDLL